MLPRMLFLRALHVGGREVLRGRPWGRPPLPLGGGGQHHGWCCLTKGMTSGDQIARAFVGFLGLRGHRWDVKTLSCRIEGEGASDERNAWVFICESLCVAGWTPSQGKWVSSRWVLGRDARKKPLHPRPEVRVVGLDGQNAWVFIGESLCAAGWTSTQGKLVSSWWGLGHEAWTKSPLLPKEGTVASDGLNAWIFIGESLCAAGWTPTQCKWISSCWKSKHSARPKLSCPPRIEGEGALNEQKA